MSKQTLNPLTTWQYDLNGQAVATTDANGQVNKQRWNYGTSQPSLAQEWHADGGTKTTPATTWSATRGR